MKILSIRKAILWILLSCIVVSGTAYAGFFYYRHMRLKRVNDEKYNIVALVQTCPEKEALKSVFLAELLGLSYNKPTNLYQFNCREAEKKLRKSPLIKRVVVKKIAPRTIHVDYVPRVPIAYLMDYTNTVVDKEGVAFPFKPFFTPKKMPEIYLGVNSEFPWGKKLEGKSWDLSLAILDILTQKISSDMQVSRIDVSNAFASSYGQREIVVLLEDRRGREVFSRILRLNTDHFEQGLMHYWQLRDYLLKTEGAGKGETGKMVSKIIDLRIPNLAFFH